MSEWLQALVLISAGIGLGLIAFIAGAWVMYRGKATPGTGEGFLKDPKGAVFTVPDDRLVDEPPGYTGEPSDDEQNILKKTEKFMSILGGKP